MRILNLRISKRKGESEEHFRSRLLFGKYLESMYLSPPYVIVEEYPPYRPKARADLVVIEYTPPRLKIEMWVEVQDTPLNASSWRMKLTKIKESFQVNLITVVLTENTKNQVSTIIGILAKLLKPFFVYFVDLAENLIFRFSIQSTRFVEVWRT